MLGIKKNKKQNKPIKSPLGQTIQRPNKKTKKEKVKKEKVKKERVKNQKKTSKNKKSNNNIDEEKLKTQAHPNDAYYTNSNDPIETFSNSNILNDNNNNNDKTSQFNVQGQHEMVQRPNIITYTPIAPETDLIVEVTLCDQVTQTSKGLNVESTNLLTGQIYSGVRLFDANLLISIQGIPNYDMHLYVIIREEGQEDSPISSIVRVLPANNPIDEITYIQLQDIVATKLDSNYEITVMIVNLADDSIDLDNLNFMEIDLTPVLVERIYEIGRCLQTSNFLVG